MHSCDPPDVLAAGQMTSSGSAPNPAETAARVATRAEFTINELASEFALTHRALRFYESRGLLAPRRDGRRRFFSRADRAGSP